MVYKEFVNGIWISIKEGFVWNAVMSSGQMSHWEQCNIRFVALSFPLIHPCKVLLIDFPLLTEPPDIAGIVNVGRQRKK